MSMESAFSRSLLMILILSETLAPPRMTVKGFPGSSTWSPRNCISFWIRKPAAESGSSEGTPTVEAWARCAVPKASLT